MNDRPDNDLDELRDRFQEMEPPRELEASVIRAVRLDRGRTQRMRHALLASAGIVLFGVGWLMGGVASSRPERAILAADRFVLLLYPSDGAPRASGTDEEASVREYAAWARAGRERGTVVGGEKLGEDRAALNGRANAPPLQGYFIIRAASMESAIDIARDCPHVRHGGRIEVRRIE